jgi:hypothetical protein
MCKAKSDDSCDSCGMTCLEWNYNTFPSCTSSWYRIWRSYNFFYNGLWFSNSLMCWSNFTVNILPNYYFKNYIMLNQAYIILFSLTMTLLARDRTASAQKFKCNEPRNGLNRSVFIRDPFQELLKSELLPNCHIFTIHPNTLQPPFLPNDQIFSTKLSSISVDPLHFPTLFIIVTLWLSIAFIYSLFHCEQFPAK